MGGTKIYSQVYNFCKDENINRIVRGPRVLAKFRSQAKNAQELAAVGGDSEDPLALAATKRQRKYTLPLQGATANKFEAAMALFNPQLIEESMKNMQLID